MKDEPVFPCSSLISYRSVLICPRLLALTSTSFFFACVHLFVLHQLWFQFIDTSLDSIQHLLAARLGAENLVRQLYGDSNLHLIAVFFGIAALGFDANGRRLVFDPFAVGGKLA